jgi:hypothetical protein
MTCSSEHLLTLHRVPHQAQSASTKDAASVAKRYIAMPPPRIPFALLLSRFRSLQTHARAPLFRRSQLELTKGRMSFFDPNGYTQPTSNFTVPSNLT